MLCPCGSETRNQQHEVRTKAKALEWFAEVKDGELPILVNQDKCPGCGRLAYSVYTSSRHKVYERG